ncbi:MAG: DUF3467 domain-containing protein [Bacteroidales bacterium]|nr:DUF3467 domain-containing protein [Bacteroidales bacterium]
MEKKIDIEIKPEIATGRYANLAIITHSSSEFILDFAQHMPGMPKMQVGSRIIMTPEHAKRLLGALTENIRKYESQFGEIRLPINPMMMPPLKSDAEA